jgi:hypothetical protein
MRAIAVAEYGPVQNLVAIETTTPKPETPYDLLIRYFKPRILFLESILMAIHKVKACSVNPVDTKARAGTYEDYPDY